MTLTDALSWGRVAAAWGLAAAADCLDAVALLAGAAADRLATLSGRVDDPAVLGGWSLDDMDSVRWLLVEAADKVPCICPGPSCAVHQ